LKQVILNGAGSISNAQICHNSTDPEDLFYAHIGRTDVFARALITADSFLQKSAHKKDRNER